MADGKANTELRQRSSTTESEALSKDKVSYAQLSSVVSKIVKESTPWELYGLDLCILLSAFCLLPVGFLVLRWKSWIHFAIGIFILGAVHVMFITKGAHSAAHGMLGPWKAWNYFWGIFFTEIVGGFTYDASFEIHVGVHHPHTNVVGLGDSSTWKVPFLGRELYLFIAPHFLPVFAPAVTIQMLWKRWKSLVKTFFLNIFGVAGQYACFRVLSNLTPQWALLSVFLARASFYCPYIHINIFQHIGLPMYNPKKRPGRVRLMASGCLNLSRNVILDYCFGHSLVNCHVEHHLFPKLSDNMCMKVKPIVKEYLEDNGLPYQEDSYWNRLKLFYQNYKEWMVDPPPLTDFIGIA